MTATRKAITNEERSERKLCEREFKELDIAHCPRCGITRNVNIKSMKVLFSVSIECVCGLSLIRRKIKHEAIRVCLDAYKRIIQ